MSLQNQHAINREQYLLALARKIIPVYIKDIANTFPQQPEYANPSYTYPLKLDHNECVAYSRNMDDLNRVLRKECQEKYGVRCELERNQIGKSEDDVGKWCDLEFKVTLY